MKMELRALSGKRAYIFSKQINGRVHQVAYDAKKISEGEAAERAEAAFFRIEYPVLLDRICAREPALAEVRSRAEEAGHTFITEDDPEGAANFEKYLRSNEPTCST